MRVDNPRFPHKCRILRKTATGPLDDESDFTPWGADIEDGNITIIYEGLCRTFDKHTTSDSGDVITSFRGLSLPLTKKEWGKLGVIPREGDEVAVDRGMRVEYGRVADVNVANFHGTHLVWRYGRN